MATLVTCVGRTDPIRMFHDGAIMHIARITRPEVIVLLHSKTSFTQQDDMIAAIESIDKDYRPQIIVDPEIIEDSKVFLYDYMFSYLQNKIREYQEKYGEIALNLTSGTPQMITALFTIIQIHELDVIGYQVTTPVRKANDDIPHDRNEDIKVLIETNEDNSPTFNNRLSTVTSENFHRSLVRRNYLELIEVNEFMGAKRLIQEHPIMDNQGMLVGNLNNVIKAIKFGSLLKEIEIQSKLSPVQKKQFNGFTLLDIQSDRDLVTESIIRAQSIVESLAFSYIKSNDRGLLKKGSNGIYWGNNLSSRFDIINEHYKKEFSRNIEINRAISFPMFNTIVNTLYPESEFTQYFNQVVDKLSERNDLAHNLEPIDSKKINLQYLTNVIRKLFVETYPDIVKSDRDKLLNLKVKIKNSLLDI